MNAKLEAGDEGHGAATVNVILPVLEPMA